MNTLIVGADDKTAAILERLRFDHGVVLIDPDGSLARAAANILPVALTERAFYFDPSDARHPAGLNVLEGVLEDDHDLLTQNICAYFDALFPEGAATLARAQSSFILATCLRIVLQSDSPNLLAVLKLLSDKSYRASCLVQCTDPVVLSNWRTITEDEKRYSSAFALLYSKLGKLLMSPVIRNIVGQQQSTFSLDRGKIVIANLDRAKLGDLTAKLLGSLLIARAKGHVVINDFGFFAADYFASLLKQDRFTLAFDFLADLKPRQNPELEQTVLSIRDKVVLRTTPADAERLASSVGISNPDVLTQLRRNEARTVNGILDLEAPPSLRRLNALKKRSRARHTRPRAAVENGIRRFLTP